MSAHQTTKKEASEDNNERRSFLGVLSGLIAAGISAVLGVTIGRFAVSPALSAAGAENWADLGPVENIAEGKPVKLNIVVSQDAGWGKFQAQRAVWVIRKESKVTVFTAVCPHLGCTVNAKDEAFFCACHDSKWDVSGNTQGGPTPRGLDALEFKVESDTLKVRYQDFKQGIPQKEVLS